MWARVARFEGDPASIDERVARLQGVADSGRIAAELEDAKFLLLVNRESGMALGITMFDSEEAMRKGDAALNPGPGEAGSRSAVGFYEVPIRLSL